MSRKSALHMPLLRGNSDTKHSLTTSYSLAMENPIVPTDPAPYSLSNSSTPLPILPTFPVLTPHNLDLSLSPQLHSSPCSSCSSSTSSPSSCINSYPSKPLHTSPSPPPSHSPSHTHKSTASVNYPTTAAEIIELLRKKICFLSGGRAKEGQSLITFPAKDKHFEYSRDDLRKVIQYLASIPM